MTDPLNSLPAFIASLRARLEAGRRAYGDRSFERPPGELLGELEQEALDLAGWGFVLFERIRRLRARVDGAATRAAEVLPADGQNTLGAPSEVLPSVLVVPVVAEIGSSADRFSPPSTRSLPAIELSRVPCAYEWLLIGGETYRVLNVRHLVGGEVAAELHCERLPALAAKGETSDTLSPVSEGA